MTLSPLPHAGSLRKESIHDLPTLGCSADCSVSEQIHGSSQPYISCGLQSSRVSAPFIILLSSGIMEIPRIIQKFPLYLAIITRSLLSLNIAGVPGD